MRGTTTARGGAEAEAGASGSVILGRRFHEFHRRLEAIEEDPSPGSVHELRIATRRLQAALVLFRPLFDFPADVTPSPLRQVERQLGKLRDLDVLTARLSTFSPVSERPEAEAAGARLAGVLVAGRKRALKRASAAIERRSLRRMAAALAAWLDDPRCSPVASFPMSLLAPDLLLPLFARTLLHPGWRLDEVPTPDTTAANPLHSLRRRLKVLRYGVECLVDWYDEPIISWLDELHAMQDALGAWHDEGLLLDRLREAQGPEAMHAESLERARGAVARWPAWRARYLDPKARASLRHLLDGPVSLP
ncbi:MAG: CHAD domain-containing protein [Gemmatimonadota bacterium]